MRNVLEIQVGPLVARITSRDIPMADGTVCGFVEAAVGGKTDVALIEILTEQLEVALERYGLFVEALLRQAGQ